MAPPLGLISCRLCFEHSHQAHPRGDANVRKDRRCPDSEVAASGGTVDALVAGKSEILDIFLFQDPPLTAPLAPHPALRPHLAANVADTEPVALPRVALDGGGPFSVQWRPPRSSQSGSPLDKWTYFRSMGADYGPFGLDCHALAAK